MRPIAERPKFENPIQALELLQQAARTRGGDYIYEIKETGICLYVRDGQCSCLIGVALGLLGWTVEEIAELDVWTEVQHEPASIVALRGVVTPDTTAGIRANSVLQAAQSEQDKPGSWNDALLVAYDAACVPGFIQSVRERWPTSQRYLVPGGPS